MATVKDFLEAIEDIAPTKLAQEWDNPGLNVGETDQDVRGVLVALDLTQPVIDEAVALGANLIVTHHPLIFHPIKTVNDGDIVGRKIISLIRNNISHIACHTNLDSAQGGVNDRLAALAGLSDVRPFPEGDEAPLGRIGTLKEELDPLRFALHIRNELGVPAVRYVAGKRDVKRVAVIGGSAAEYWSQAKKEGADALLTGDTKYNQLLPAAEEGFTIVDAGHFGTESPVVPELAKRLSEIFPGVDISISERGLDCVRFV